MNEQTAAEPQPHPGWRPLNPTQRRVLGVLMEKAKTTPDAYPMTLKAITTGANQKSNRDPQMDLDPDRVEQALDELREMKAVAEIQGDGRVPKYRHFAYEWFGVDKIEMAIMAELLLRGEQTVGDLRARAARMEPISGLDELMPILARLIERKLVVPLTPAGRGQMVTHGLYKDRELNDLNRQYRGGYSSPAAPPPASDFPESPAVASRPPAASSAAEVSPEQASQSTTPSTAALDELRADFNELREEVERLRREVEELQALLS